MRLLALGDLHGCYTALKTLEQNIPFTDDDLIVALGDYVDRGPESKEVIEWILQRTDRRLCAPLRGNHEIMMLEAMQGHVPLQSWLQFGGDTVLASYSEDGRGRPEDVTLEHLQFLAHELLPWFETPGHIFVHASLEPDVALAEQPEDSLYWERFENISPHVSGKQIICGHTAQKTGVPLDKGYAVCIDTWCYGGGWLTCLDVDTGQYWQANERGDFRSDWLPNAKPRTESADVDAAEVHEPLRGEPEVEDDDPLFEGDSPSTPRRRTSTDADWLELD